MSKFSMEFCAGDYDYVMVNDTTEEKGSGDYAKEDESGDYKNP